MGDIATSGKQFVTGTDEVAQTIKTRLGLFLGEYFRDITDGTPWFQSILGKGSSVANKEAQLRRRIVRTEGVLKLTKFETSFDVQTRKYTVNVSALTTDGAITLGITNDV
jgi:hypothetical protein